MDPREILSLTQEQDACDPGKVSRRRFFGMSAASLAGVALAPGLIGQDKPADQVPKPTAPPPPIKTNIDEIKAIPRTKESLPGRYPGRVIKLETPGGSVSGKINAVRAREAVNRGMAELTGTKQVYKAWKQFVSAKDVVGIKVNPIAGKILTTNPEVVDAIIAGLEEAGVARKNIIIWDRRLFQLQEAGFVPERFPGIRILGTEMKGPNGEFYDGQGALWAKDNIDREAPAYIADVEQKYDKETLPYMINEGKESYFTKIVTREVTKIINVPVLKNAGAAVTLCLKNLSYGALSNTGRLHKLWNNSVAEPCAFPVLRDKVVLNIVDGLQACYEGGPGANPKYIWDANLMFFGTDPVAIDAVAHDLIIKERMKRGVQQMEDKRRRVYLDIAEGLGLGIAAADKIELKELALP